MAMDPSEFFQKLGDVQRDASEAQSKAKYYENKAMIHICEFQNECRNPNTSPASLELIREKIHDAIDLMCDSTASTRMLAEKFEEWQRSSGGQPDSQ